MRENLRNKIFQINDDAGFEKTCIEVFRYQYKFNTIYRKFTDLLDIAPSSVDRIGKIPFLPIEFFKVHKVVTGKPNDDFTVFESSGTTGADVSRHYVKEMGLYRESFSRGFELFFGPVRLYSILALLPSYLERPGSSLVFMINDFIERTSENGSGSYLYDHEALLGKVQNLLKAGKKVILWGVSFALLDLAGRAGVNLKDVTVIETGGMKGRRREMTREELHELLKKGLNIETVNSEYGMTELLSQAYSSGNGIFRTVPWMKVLTRDMNDPFAYTARGKTGGINIIDLANIDSCSFIATQDLGKLHDNGSFEVMGRFDNSDVRGCNLMI
jgi:phenylacetate-coenzyme A ligase PaaK-like adenylate-forming protein